MTKLSKLRRTYLALRRVDEHSPIVWASVEGIPFNPEGWKKGTMFHYREGYMVFICDIETGLTLAYGTALPQASSIFRFLWADVPEAKMREELQKAFDIVNTDKLFPGPKPKL